MNMNRWMIDRLVRLRENIREELLSLLPGFDQPESGLAKALSPGRIRGQRDSHCVAKYLKSLVLD